MTRFRLEWTPSLVTLAFLGAAIVGVQVLPWPVNDFRPFVMTIEAWNHARIGYSDGTTRAGTEMYRLEYRRYNDWKMTLTGDDVAVSAIGQGWECRNGTFLTFDPQGKTTTRSNDSTNCNGVARWIHYGLAESYPWHREVADGQVTYTDPGERVVFDLATGLPVLYEAGPPGGNIGERMTFRVEHYGP